MNSKADRIEAEVVLRQRAPAGSESGRSARQLESASEIVEQVSDKLRKLGFEVLATTPTSISIAGTRGSFIEAFKTTDSSSQPDSFVPGDLEDYVEGVYVQVPPTYF